MTELEMLLAQKKDIEAKIKEIKEEKTTYGRAKLMTESYARGIVWKVKYKIDASDYWNDARVNTVAMAQSREKCIEHLKNVITDLQGLLEKVEGDE